MFTSCKITLPPNAIKHEYEHHRNHFVNINDFRQFIIHHNELSNHSFDQYGNATIKYNKLLRNNEPIFGIYKNYTLQKFITQNNNNNKKRKKYKSRRKIHVKKDGRSYDEDTSRNGNIKITKKMSIDILPNIINETQIKNMFGYMSKLSTLNPPSYNNKIWIINLGLTDKNTNKYIYFIGDRIPGNTAHSYKWKMRDNIYTQQQIIELSGVPKDELPIAIKDTTQFKRKLNNVGIMEQMLNDEKIQQILFNTKIKWENVPVFTNEKQTNKTQLHLNKSKPIFISDIKNILREMDRIRLQPILLFNHNPEKDNYNIDGILRIKLNDNDIGISFKYNNGKMLPSGFHLDLNNILLMCQLANPSSFNSYFNGWRSSINDMSIGNKDKYKNQFNAKSVECDMYKQKSERYENVLYDMINALNTMKHNGIQMDKQLSNLMRTGSDMLQSKYDSNVINSMPVNNSNQNIKHETANIRVPVYSNTVVQNSIPSAPMNYGNVPSLNVPFSTTLPMINSNEFNILNGGSVNLLAAPVSTPTIGLIPAASMLIGQGQIQTHAPMGNVQNNNISNNIINRNIEPVPLNIDAQVFIPTPNKTKLETIMET